MTAISTQLTPNPASGNITANGTEQTLASTASLAQGATLEFSVDCANMAAGDTVKLRVYANVNSANDRLVQVAEFSGVQEVAMKASYARPIEAGGRYKVTMQQTAGTYRSFQWKVLEL